MRRRSRTTTRRCAMPGTRVLATTRQAKNLRPVRSWLGQRDSAHRTFCRSVARLVDIAVHVSTKHAAAADVKRRDARGAAPPGSPVTDLALGTAVFGGKAPIPDAI